MRIILISSITGFYFLLPVCRAQQVPALPEEQLESLVANEQEGIEDDQYILALEQFRKQPIDLNKADMESLKLLGVFTELQLENFISYRQLLGSFIDKYELQAIPGWDLVTIKKILPYITVNSMVDYYDEISKRLRRGDHSILLRCAQQFPEASGFRETDPASRYQGSPQSLFFRYRYTFKNLLQYGFTGDKDAGERFLGGAQKHGFDFSSFHFFARGLGIIKAIALGDFTINMGQGLIQWQGLAFRKSAEVMSVKRQSPVIRPYTSAGEFYFFRGAGITFQAGKLESTLFASYRKPDANLFTDTITRRENISSFLTAGLHRTLRENENRYNTGQSTAGINLTYRLKKWDLGVNMVYYHFSNDILKRDEPYNLYAIKGNQWYNSSIHYSYTLKNLHFFGEVASDKNLKKSFLNGMLLSADSHVDVSFLYRHLDKAYQSINGNAFTENTMPSNETGFYSGITIRPGRGLKLDAYADLFQFPWLKYSVDAPSHGSDFLIQLSYSPSRQVEMYSRFRVKTKQSNGEHDGGYLFLTPTIKCNWRTHISYRIHPDFTIRNRVEICWYNQGASDEQEGFLTYLDILYKPMMKPWSLVGRVQYFDADGYESGIYAYENDVLYTYSVPSFSDQGYRYYINISYDLTRQLSFWVRWSQTIYNNTVIGSKRTEKKSEGKLQIRWIF